jgi:hypothetical protein
MKVNAIAIEQMLDIHCELNFHECIKILGFYGGKYEECHLLGCAVVWLM